MKKNLAEAAEARKFAEAKPQVSTTSYRDDDGGGDDDDDDDGGDDNDDDVDTVKNDKYLIADDR